MDGRFLVENEALFVRGWNAIQIWLPTMSNDYYPIAKGLSTVQHQAEFRVRRSLREQEKTRNTGINFSHRDLHASIPIVARKNPQAALDDCSVLWFKNGQTKAVQGRASDPRAMRPTAATPIPRMTLTKSSCTLWR